MISNSENSTTLGVPHQPARKRGALLAVCSGMLVAALFLLANVPGNPNIGPEILSTGKYGPHFECGFESMRHGWPLVWLAHDGYFSRAGDGPSAWSIGEHPKVAPAALGGNLLLLVAATLTVVWAVRRRMQKHGWRFRLIELLAVVVVVAVALALARARHDVHQAQLAFLQSSQTNPTYPTWQPFGPYWLRQLTGSRFWEWGDTLAEISIEHSDEIENLPGRDEVKVLTIYTVRSDAMPSLQEYEQLLAIDMSLVNYDYSNFEDEGDPEFWPCLRVISRCDSIQALNLYDTGVTDRGLEEFARMQNLANLELSANNDVTDRGLAHLASVKSLKMLGLWGTGVSSAGVARLQTALPDCDIGWDENQ